GRACRAGAPRLPESRLPQRPGAAPDARDAAPPAGGLDRGTRAGVRLSNTPPGMARSTTDFLVVGGGILGLTLALELTRRPGDCSVTLREQPRARPYERALFSPSTATVQPGEVVASLVADAGAAGIAVLTGVAYRGREPRGSGVVTSAGTIDAGYVVNAAGLYADRVARDYGF